MGLGVYLANYPFETLPGEMVLFENGYYWQYKRWMRKLEGCTAMRNKCFDLPGKFEQTLGKVTC